MLKKTMLKLKTIPILLSFLITAPFSQTHAEVVTAAQLEEVINEFTQVDKNLYRGAQPPEEAFKLLKDFGIKTIISFRHESDVIEKEQQQVEALGLRFVSLPWRIQFHPDQPVMRQFLDELKDKKKGPFFFHCRRGSERTGVAEAIFQYYIKKKSKDDAWKLAMEGHPLLFYWKPFVKKRLKDFHYNLASQTPQKP